MKNKETFQQELLREALMIYDSPKERGAFLDGASYALMWFNIESQKVIDDIGDIFEDIEDTDNE